MRPEFWRDCGGPLWNDKGKPVDPGISPKLAERVHLWNSQYEEDRIPLNGPGNPGWRAEGVSLLAQVAHRRGR